jgi:hypothetical protein
VTSYGSTPWSSTLGTLGGNETSTYGAFIYDIHDYASSTNYKTIRQFGGVDQNTSGGYARLASGLWLNTNAITSITLKPASGSLGAGTTFALYGIN